jgi:GxxExxY protein
MGSLELVHGELTGQVVDAAMEVHRLLGPGLLESVYEACLVHELQNRGLRCQRQVPIPMEFKGSRLDCSFRADVVVEDSVLLELKAIESLLPIHEAQLFTYLRLSGCKVGFLINFNVKALKDGIIRRVL